MYYSLFFIKNAYLIYKRMKKNWPARLLTVCYGNHVMESSLAPFLFAHFGSPVIIKETNYRNEITGQFSLTPDLCYPEQPILFLDR